MTNWIEPTEQLPRRGEDVLLLIEHNEFLTKPSKRIRSCSVGHIPPNVDYWKIGNNLYGYQALGLFDRVLGWSPLPQQVEPTG